jgi:hypothetical protein
MSRSEIQTHHSSHIVTNIDNLSGGCQPSLKTLKLNQVMENEYGMYRVVEKSVRCPSISACGEE